MGIIFSTGTANFRLFFELIQSFPVIVRRQSRPTNLVNIVIFFVHLNNSCIACVCIWLKKLKNYVVGPKLTRLKWRRPAETSIVRHKIVTDNAQCNENIYTRTLRENNQMLLSENNIVDSTLCLLSAKKCFYSHKTIMLMLRFVRVILWSALLNSCFYSVTICTDYASCSILIEANHKILRVLSP